MGAKNIGFSAMKRNMFAGPKCNRFLSDGLKALKIVTFPEKDIQKLGTFQIAFIHFRRAYEKTDRCSGAGSNFDVIANS